MRTILKAALATLAAAALSVAAFAAGEFEGTWKVKDTKGKEFNITLAAGGKASADRGEGLTGTWKEDGGVAVITWSTGWTTKIAKEGSGYKKTAYKKGDAAGEPANTSDAAKVK